MSRVLVSYREQGDTSCIANFHLFDTGKFIHGPELLCLSGCLGVVLQGEVKSMRYFWDGLFVLLLRPPWKDLE